VDDVDAAEGGEHALDGGLYLGIFGDVAGEAEVARAEFGGGGGGGGAVAGDERHAGSLAGESESAIAADAGGAAGEEDDLVFEQHDGEGLAQVVRQLFYFRNHYVRAFGCPE